MKRKIIFAAILALLMLMLGANAIAAGDFTISSDGTITDYTGSATELVIPDTIDGIKVKAIGKQAFYYCGVTSVTIPDSVSSIGYSAFECCYRLTSVTIPDSVSSIGDYAFYGCSGLTSISIPDGISSIEFSTFDGCSSLSSISIPDSVSSTRYDAFSDCGEITICFLGMDMPAVDSYAFANSTPTIHCYKSSAVDRWAQENGYTTVYFDALILPADLTSIESEAFMNIDAESVVIPDDCPSIGSRAFADCGKLKMVFIPGSVTEIAPDAFANCRDFTICTPAGSRAQSFANEQNIPFIAK